MFRRRSAQRGVQRVGASTQVLPVGHISVGDHRESGILPAEHRALHRAGQHRRHRTRNRRPPRPRRLPQRGAHELQEHLQRCPDRDGLGARRHPGRAAGLAEHVAVLGPQRPGHGLRGRRNILHIDDGHLTAAGQRKASGRVEQLGAQALFDLAGVQSAVERPHRAHRLSGQDLQQCRTGSAPVPPTVRRSRRSPVRCIARNRADR